MPRVNWEVSKDGKTVTVGKKTYSMSAFKNQFTDIVNPYLPANSDKKLAPGMSGSAEPSGKKVVTPKVDSSPEKAKSRAEAKRYKKSVAKMNEAGVGKKLLERNQGGITSGTGKKNVAPVYRNIGVPMGGMGFPNTLNQ